MHVRYAPSAATLVTLACLVVISITSGSYSEAATGSALLKDAKLEDKDKALFYGGCDSDPYEAIKPFLGGGQIIPVKTASGLQNGVDPALVCRLSKMLEAAKQRGCMVKTVSGYRSAAHQRSICGSGGTGCAPPGRSCHQPGLAVDLSTDCGGWLRQAAPRFRLTFPYSGIHVQCAEHPVASVSSCNRPCDNGAVIVGDLSDLGSPRSSSPLGLGNQFRNLIGGGQPSGLGAQPAPQPQPAPVPQQPAPIQTSQLLGNPGGLGTMPPPLSMPPPLISGTSTSNNDTGPDQASYYSSVADQLLQLAYDTPLPNATATATSVPLTIDGTDIGGVQSANDAVGATATNYLAYGAPGTVLPSTNTFVSNDLGGGPYEVVASYRGEPTGFVALLIQLRDAFAALLNILRPMGIREALVPSAADHEEAYIDLEYDPVQDFNEGVNAEDEVEIVIQ